MYLSFHHSPILRMTYILKCKTVIFMFSKILLELVKSWLSQKAEKYFQNEQIGCSQREEVGA